MEKLNFTLTKKRTYEMKPFGRFLIKFNPSKAIAQRPHILPMNDLKYDSEKGMPLDGVNDETDNQIVKYMKKNKTDILTDGYRFYSRAGTFTEVSHVKLDLYESYLKQFGVEDNAETWDNYKNGR